MSASRLPAEDGWTCYFSPAPIEVGKSRQEWLELARTVYRAGKLIKWIRYLPFE